MVKKRSRTQNRLIVVAMVIVAVLVSSWVISGDILITGYGGLTTEIIDVEGDGVITNNGLAATVDKVAFYNPWPLTTDPTGVKLEVQGRANILETIVERPTVVDVIDNGDGTFTEKTYEVKITKYSIGITARTEGVGLDTAYGMTFTIKVQENQFDVFSEADDCRAYILEIYTTDVVDDTTLMEGIPASIGYYFPMTSLSIDDDVPSWIREGGYQASLSALESVSFDIVVSHAQPNSWLGGYRTENSMSWDIGIDMLTFGYWEQTGPNRNFTPPPSDKTLWDMLIMGFLDGLDQMGPLLAMVTIIAVAVVIVVVIVKFGWIIKKK